MTVSIKGKLRFGLRDNDDVFTPRAFMKNKRIPKVLVPRMKRASCLRVYHSFISVKHPRVHPPVLLIQSTADVEGLALQ